jgi:threonine synthase
VAAQRLIAEGFLKSDAWIVIYTGSGLKYPEACAASFPRKQL